MTPQEKSRPTAGLLAISSWKNTATIPPPRRSARGAQIALRGPTRQKAALKRKSGRCGPFDSAQGRRDDMVGLPQKSRLSSPFGYAQGKRDDTTGAERTHPLQKLKPQR